MLIIVDSLPKWMLFEKVPKYIVLEKVPKGIIISVTDATTIIMSITILNPFSNANKPHMRIGKQQI